MISALVLMVAAAGTFLNVPGESAARMAWGLDVPSAGSHERTARSFLAENAGAFGLVPDDELVLAEDRAGVATFERRRASVPVLGHEVKVTFDDAERLVMVHAGPPLPLAQGSFLVDVVRAEAVATRGLDGVELLEAQRTWRFDGLELRPAWLVRFNAGGLAQPMRAYVDAETGRLVYRVSERLSAGMGAVYDVSPAKGPVVMRALGGLPTNATTLVGSRAAGRDCNGGGVGGGCTQRAMANASFDFVYTPSFLVNNSDRFGEVNAYYATDRFSAWLAALDAGVTLPPIDIYTNVGGSDQGFFLGGSTRFGIELGQGPEADWAYEGDVIFHELGHGVVQRSAGFGFYGLDAFGIAGEGGSLNEGSADCVAMALSGDAVLAEFIGPYLQDAGSLITPYLRRMDNPITCHGRDGNLDGGDPGRFGQIHDDGRILGSFFWALHSRTQSLGPYAAAFALVRALRSVSSSAGFNEVAIAVRQHLTNRYGNSAGDLVACLQCERDMPGCATRTRRIYDGETHESRLLGNDTPSPTMGNGEKPSTFQYELQVPANATVTFDRFQITRGALPKLYARFGQRVTWSGGNPTFDAVITGVGQVLPAQPTAGTWYLQGALTDPGMGTRRYGIRAQVQGGGAPRPAGPVVSCSLGSGIGPCGVDAGCTPQCSGLMCGSDGCGGSCGTCDAGTMCSGAGTCVCAPRCAGRVCGPDGCGGMCGMCASGACDADAGVCVGCTPMCAGRQCGGNGCGQACGQCMGMNEICEVSTGQCLDAGELPVADAGVDAGTGGSGGGGGTEEVRGGCGCGAAPPVLVLLAGMVLMARRRRGKNGP